MVSLGPDEPFFYLSDNSRWFRMSRVLNFDLSHFLIFAVDDIIFYLIRKNQACGDSDWAIDRPISSILADFRANF